MAKVQTQWLLRSVLALVGGLSVVMADELRPEKKADSAPKSKPVEKVKAESPSVIGYLETRDHVVVIKRDSKFTVKNKAGKVLAEDVALDKLQTGFPDLYKLVNGAVAKDGSFNHAGIRTMILR